MKSILFIFFLTFSSDARARTVVGILDSGFDLAHEMLQDKIFNNPFETRNGEDDDRNGAVDDIVGWNLLDSNEILFDETLRNSFPETIYKYYRMRAKKSLGTITEAELKWYNEIREDENFKESKKGFTSYIHGTHVAGIATQSTDPLEDYEILLKPIRYLGSREKGLWVEPAFIPNPILDDTQAIDHIKKHLLDFVDWQMKKLEAGIRLASNQSDVINGSFGKSFKSVNSNSETFYHQQFGRKPPEDIQTELSLYFANHLVKRTETVLEKFPHVLFVFSAGNSKDDNDKLPHYPSNARADNVLAVGASNHHVGRAYFSNFGVRTVDVFAPGLAIKSSVPDNRYLQVNGTSQSSSYVTNLAAKMIELSKKIKVKLTTSMLTKIIMKTVDQKSSMELDCVSGGIVNPNRALHAVTLLENMTLNKAIESARKNVEDINSTVKTIHTDNSLLLDLPSPF